MFYEVLTILFFTCTSLDIVYLISTAVFISEVKTKYNKEDEEAVSVVIAAKNEAENLRKHLPLILKQNYFNYEIIIVNDHSNDDTLNFLNHAAEQNTKLKVLDLPEIPPNYNSKKYALKKGIEIACNPIILLTDADCYPATDNWIKEMAQALGDKEIVLGYSPFQYKKKNILNIYQQFESLYTAICYFFLAGLGAPYMGVGRNLMYRRSIYFKQNGFNNLENIKGGDDDLFLQKVFKKDNTHITYRKEAQTFTYPKNTWTRYFLQKLRHYGVGYYYKTSIKILLFVLDFNRLLMYLLTLYLLICVPTAFFVIYFFLRTAFFLLSYYVIINKLKPMNIKLTLFILFDFLHIIQRHLLGIISYFFNPKKW